MNGFGVPPEVLMGEAGVCSFWAMVAVAYVYRRNDRMNGWDEKPDCWASLAAWCWWVLPDLSRGASFVFSERDLRLTRVREIVKGLGPPKVRFKCLVGGLVFY